MGASASREKFRESVSALIEVDVSADDADFWDELWKIPNSGEEVFELIPPAAAPSTSSSPFDAGASGDLGSLGLLGAPTLSFRHDVPTKNLNWGMRWSNSFDGNRKTYDLVDIELSNCR